MIRGRENQIREIVKCGKDPLYFINNYVQIQHPGRGTVSFKTYPFQDKCLSDFLDHRFNIEGTTVRNVNVNRVLCRMVSSFSQG